MHKVDLKWQNVSFYKTLLNRYNKKERLNFSIFFFAKRLITFGLTRNLVIEPNLRQFRRDTIEYLMWSGNDSATFVNNPLTIFSRHG